MERTGSRISLFLAKRKEVFPGLDNALCRETRFRRTTSSVKPIIDGYHSSLVYINDSMRSFTENIGNNWWYANVRMANTVNTDFFFSIFLQMCRYFCKYVIHRKIFTFDFFWNHIQFWTSRKILWFTKKFWYF